MTLQRPLFAALCFALLLGYSGCGEIELPGTERPADGQTETPGTDIPPATGDDPAPDEPAPEQGGETPGEDPTDPAPEAKDLQVGRATLTADGHLLIDGRFYLSLKEWREVPSALNEAEPTGAARRAADYEEGDLKDWHIPTTEEAALLREIYCAESQFYGKEELPTLNKELYARELEMFYRTEPYLFNEAREAFTLELGARTTKATKTKKYRLRVVHDR